MANLLAIEASTDSCSVALSIGGDDPRELYEHAPRRHNQLLFEMLHELVPNGDIRCLELDCIAYGNGPGSFTGLRVAASAAQGLAFSCGLPVAPVSTLAALAQGALREGSVSESSSVLCSLDAKIGEVYYALCSFAGGLPEVVAGPRVNTPEEICVPAGATLTGIGDGMRLLEQFPPALQARISTVLPHITPRARDILPLAQAFFQREEVQLAADVQPVYVRDEISWKKLSEQGKPA